ncbi:transporter [Candidatus Sulfidibacterium hydrothermale]|uniref:aspartate:alanine exchanger family transporter n=1 Tax=Candidatus Sulfidibacterium hydrothermale TaxID=2875962 RepID=UPI001F0B0A57|nr:aspartate:alanine exchanger family transporter [Candidatus Sulfidibacterium hydrothermale]UBM63552.1 transporter [Candidatus Sulfidibacterium hydrothermale]
MDWLTFLLTKDYFVLFLVIGLGIMVGRINFKGVKFELSAVIFVALFFGYFYHHYGIDFEIPSVIQDVGLVLFIYTIGMQAGPSFFSAFKEQGAKMLILAAIIVVSGAMIAVLIAFAAGVDMPLMTGLFTGALTSTPGLAAAIEASGSPLASIGYGVAYPFGVLGVILFIKISPKIFRVDLKKEEEKFKKSSRLSVPVITHKTFVVTNENIHGKSLEQLHIYSMTCASISRIMRENGELIVPAPDVALYKGDMVKAVGTEKALRCVEVLIGKPTPKVIPQSGNLEIKWFVVSNERVVNKSLEELNLLENYHATVTRIRRSGIELMPLPSVRLRYGDKVLVSVHKGNVPQLTALLGDSLKHISETSFLPVAVGIVLGIVVGTLELPFGNLHVKLGLTGGVLLTSLFFSWKGKTGPLVWNLSGPANQLLRQMGLLLFLTPVGIRAGEHLTAALSQYGFNLFGYGVLITLIPMFIATFVGKVVLKINFLSLMGALTGGMTSTPGLSAAESMTETEAPQLAYAAVYPFSLVLVILVAELMSALA